MLMRNLTLAMLVFVGTSTAATAQITVEITEQDCSQLVRHIGSDDASYTPGVDVKGNKVTPADLDGTGQISAPDAISIPLTLDLASRLGIPPGGNADYLARPVIGDVVVSSDGHVTFNGVPLTSESQRELALKCQQIGVAR